MRANENWNQVPFENQQPGLLPTEFRPLRRTCVFARAEKRAAADDQDEGHDLILRSVGAGIVSFGIDGRVAFANPAACALLGSPLAALRGSTVNRLLFAMIDADGKPIVADAFRIERGDGPRSLTVGRGLVPHERRWLSIDVTTVAAGDASRTDCSMVWAITDVTRFVRAQEQLAARATTDDLTGLPNRPALADASRRMLAHAAADDAGVAMLVLDLDGFKQVNDRLGHATGDLLLQNVAERLSGIVMRPNLLGRRSGDEFVLLLPGGDEHDAARMAEEVLDALSAPFELDQQDVEVGASIGAALFPCHGATEEEIFRCADAALYEAKRGGRRRFRVYQPRLRHAPPAARTEAGSFRR